MPTAFAELLHGIEDVFGRSDEANVVGGDVDDDSLMVEVADETHERRCNVRGLSLAHGKCCQAQRLPLRVPEAEVSPDCFGDADLIEEARGVEAA